MTITSEPAPTLAEELRHPDLSEWSQCGPSVAAFYADHVEIMARRVEMIEQERDEARAEVERLTAERKAIRDALLPDGGSIPPGMGLAEAVRILGECLEHEGKTAERWKRERDEACSEVGRLTEEREYWKEYALERQRVVERLVAAGNDAPIASEENVAPDQRSNPKETLASSFKSSLKEPAQNPADVPPGEPWLIRVDGKEHAAFRRPKAFKDAVWGYWDEGPSSARDDEVALVSRLVPAPRVITDPDELDKLPDGALPLDVCMQALRKTDGGWAPADVGSLPKS